MGNNERKQHALATQGVQSDHAIERLAEQNDQEIKDLVHSLKDILIEFRKNCEGGQPIVNLGDAIRVVLDGGKMPPNIFAKSKQVNYTYDYFRYDSTSNNDTTRTKQYYHLQESTANKYKINNALTKVK